MQTPDTIPPSRQALVEALKLSEEILQNVELSELPLANVALKTSRLARLLNEFNFQKIMEFEVGGYPLYPDGMPPDMWQLAVAAGRKFSKKDKPKQGVEKVNEYIYRESIGQLEEQLRVTDSLITVSSAPVERYQANRSVADITEKIASRKAFIYQYVLRKHHELKFSGIADDVFTRIRSRLDKMIGQTIPEGSQRLSAMYEYLRSENPVDWSSAVHSCRRILEDLADVLYPPRESKQKVLEGGKTKTIALGQPNYINRLVAFI